MVSVRFCLWCQNNIQAGDRTFTTERFGPPITYHERCWPHVDRCTPPIPTQGKALIELKKHAADLVAIFDGKKSPNMRLVTALNGMEDALEALADGEVIP